MRIQPLPCFVPVVFLFEHLFLPLGEIHILDGAIRGFFSTQARSIGAGDFTEEANRKKVILVRANGGGKFTINLARVDEPDPKVYPGDQIIVPRK